MTTLTPAIAIVRVSTGRQDEASQIPDVEKFAAQEGYDLTHVERVHGASAFHGKHLRQVHAAIERHVSKGSARAVIFWKLDRSTREGLEGAVELRKHIRNAGAAMLFATQPYLNSNDASSEMMFANLAIMAREESLTKSDRIKIKQAALRASGSFVGKAPYGLRIVPTGDGRKTLAPVEVEAATVRRVFDLVAQGTPVSTVARVLHSEGLRTRKGYVWSEKVVNEMVKNETYRGVVLDPEGREYMRVEAVVSSTLWERANVEVRNRPQSKGFAARKGGRPSSTLLRPACGNCGAPMYRYGTSYRCKGVGPAGNSAQAKGCGNTISLDVLDAEVTEEFLASDFAVLDVQMVEGSDHSEEIADVRLTMRGLDPEADEEEYDRMRAELKRLRSLPVEAPRMAVVPVRDAEGNVLTEGRAFAAMSPEERRTHLRAWTLTVFPKGSEVEGRRWKLSGGPEAQARAFIPKPSELLKGLRAA